jgi:hypothetical protein
MHVCMYIHVYVYLFSNLTCMASFWQGKWLSSMSIIVVQVFDMNSINLLFESNSCIQDQIFISILELIIQLF